MKDVAGLLDLKIFFTFIADSLFEKLNKAFH